MTEKELKLLTMKNRLAILSASAKNIKCPGVVRKLRRNIRTLEAELKNCD